MKRNITLLIPLLLVISTLGTSYVLYTKQNEQAISTIKRDALAMLKLDITRLQNVLYNLITERGNKHIDEARVNLSVTAMDTSIKTLLLTGGDDRVILANRYIWEGDQADNISAYEPSIAGRVRAENHPIIISENGDRDLLKGYYPVVLQLESAGGLPVKRLGTLYAEVSTASRLAMARNDAANLSLVLGGILLAVSVVVAILLHLLVSKRLGRLTKASARFASGDLTTKVSIGGNDELTTMGQAFNDMTQRVKMDILRRQHAEDELQLLNRTLEQRVEERTAELEQKRLELLDSQARAHHANKLAALGEMASGIAHEINSPLQVISILTYKLRRSLKKPDTIDIREAADDIDQAVERVTNIVESLRKMSRDSSGDPFEEVMLSDIIADVTGITSERYKLKGIRFEVNYHNDAEDTSLDCQRLQVSQILINLLNNAYDAVLESAEKCICVDIYDQHDTIRIVVTDSGPGIRGIDRQNIFNPMFTTKDIGLGTGIGLSISSEIADHHGGSLTLDDDSENTRFVLTLPKIHHQDGKK